MKFTIAFVLLFHTSSSYANLRSSDGSDKVENVFDSITDIIDLNLKSNGWNNILCIGHLPDNFYTKIQHIAFTFVVTNIDRDDHYVEDLVPYHPHFIVINGVNFTSLDLILRKVSKLPYWHPNANIILYYEEKNNINIANIFFLLWYYKACNAIIVQYHAEKSVSITYYSPYMDENFKLNNTFGCWTRRRLGKIIKNFEEDLICVEGCHNVTLASALRSNNLGTCIGFNTVQATNGDRETIKKFNLFEDKTKNFHGFAFTAFITEILPFLTIDANGDGSFTLGARDGIIWNTVAELMNFTIDLTPSVSIMKEPFHFELVIQQLFAFAQRKVDLFLIPVYQFDLIFVEIDHTFPLKGSGACLLSHRADFETILFNMRILEDSFELILRFLACFICIWGFLCIFNLAEVGYITLDQIGRDLLNTVRNVLLISLHRPSNKRAFRIFLGISLWSFFVLNFVSQASIVSFFTAIKRGKEVDTFEDILEKGYPIEAMASPDIILPSEVEKYRKINSKVVPSQNLFACVKRMINDSRRFCLIDCSVAYYLERNLLNERGEQYLHVLKDRIHSHYLNTVLPKHSPMTERLSKHIMSFFEAGLVIKWEQYRYNIIKSDATVKPLGMDDFIGIYKAYAYSLGFISTIFMLEVVWGNIYRQSKLEKGRRA